MSASQIDAQKYFEGLENLCAGADALNASESSDHAVAIVGPALLDSMLADILTGFLIDNSKEVETLLRPDGPLGTFGNRTRMASCLGLISSVIATDLRIVAKVRNRFAHSVCMTFDDEKVRSRVHELKFHITYLNCSPPKDATSKHVFQIANNTLISHLHGLIGLAQMEKRNARDSP
jgi:DNA-binding MltR family transcriptional regulator